MDTRVALTPFVYRTAHEQKETVPMARVPSLMTICQPAVCCVKP